MLTRGDIADALYERLFAAGPGEAPARPKARPPAGPPARKVFLSDRELRRMVGPGQKKLSVPRNAIVSPLALDWLEYDGVELIRE